MGILDRQGTLVEIDGLKLPKYGALKVREVEAFNEFVQKWPELRKGLTQPQADALASKHMISILLQRLDPEWDIEKTLAKDWTLPMDGQIGGKTATFEPDVVLTDELYTFFCGERDRWPKPEASAAEQNETDEPGKPQTGKRSSGSSRKRTQATKTSKASKDS